MTTSPSNQAVVPGIFMVDDNALAAAALERRFSGSSELRWLGWTDDPSAVIALVSLRRPAVVLLDVDMPLIDSFALLLSLRAECPWTAVVMFSGLNQPALIERALHDGAAGYIHKDEPTAQIAALIGRAAAGECVLSPLASKTYMRGGDTRP